MQHSIIDCGHGFWNLRGSFKIAGLLDIGTQASLVRLTDGRFVFLDSYSLTPEQRAEVDAITGGKVAAVLNTHPFHTVHCAAMQAAFPEAKHYGTARHIEKFPDLKWEELRVEDPALWAEFAPNLEFSVPDGVTFIHPNQNIHCASVLVWHPASRSLHVDDTFGMMPAKGMRKKPKISVHPTLRFALEKRPGAAAEFRGWGEKLMQDWAEPRWLCAAHSGALSSDQIAGGSIGAGLKKALAAVGKTLAKHEAKWGA